jgi:hypothetical protein
LRPRKEENLLLDVGSEIEQRHDLRCSRRRDVADIGQLRLVGDNAVADQVLAASIGKERLVWLEIVRLDPSVQDLHGLLPQGQDAFHSSRTGRIRYPSSYRNG